MPLRTNYTFETRFMIVRGYCGLAAARKLQSPDKHIPAQSHQWYKDTISTDLIAPLKNADIVVSALLAMC